MRVAVRSISRQRMRASGARAGKEGPARGTPGGSAMALGHPGEPWDARATHPSGRVARARQALWEVLATCLASYSTAPLLQCYPAWEGPSSGAQGFLAAPRREACLGHFALGTRPRRLRDFLPIAAFCMVPPGGPTWWVPLEGRRRGALGAGRQRHNGFHVELPIAQVT